MLVIACLLYAAAMVLANLSVFFLGPWASPINAFLLIGLDLTLRDRLHDAWSGKGLAWRMPSLIAFSSLATYLLNPGAGRIAVASAVAFAAAALVDWSTYAALRSRGYMTRTNGSNAVSALSDSILFPTLAFGSFLPSIMAMQFVAKVAGGAVWALVLREIFTPPTRSREP